METSEHPLTDHAGPTVPVTALAYEAPPESRSGWPTAARWTAAATAALAGAYFLNGLAVGAYYVTFGRFGQYGLYLVGVYSWPLYLLPLWAGVLCLRRPDVRHWTALKWGLIVMIVLRALVALANVAIGVLAASPSSSALVNIAGAAMIGQYFFNGMTDVVPPAAMLWLATRPAFREVFVRP